MRTALLSAAMLIAMIGSASAQTTTSEPFNQALPSWATVVNFDSPLPNGFSLEGGRIVQGSGPGYAAPAGDTTKYLTTDIGRATVSADKGYQSIGFYWGSIDKYNTVSLLDTAGALIAKFTGNDVPPASGDQTSGATNRYVSYTLDPGSAIAGIQTLVFESTGLSFEVDDVAFGTAPGSPAPIPEPATLGLFALGVGLLGRRLGRRRTV